LTDHKAGVTHINHEAMRMRDSGVFNKDMASIVQAKKNRPGLWWPGRLATQTPEGRRT
jgi:hypothetical protein